MTRKNRRCSRRYCYFNAMPESDCCPGHQDSDTLDLEALSRYQDKHGGDYPSDAIEYPKSKRPAAL